MDMRFVAFDLIARDAALRTLLVNYGRRLGLSGALRDPATTTDFIALTWTPDERASAPAGSELLTAQVHVSRNDSDCPERLDRVLQRLRAALTAAGPNRCITVRCLSTSGEDVDSRFGTVCKTSTWAIAPVPTRRDRGTGLRLAPWSGPVELDAGGRVVSGTGAPSMN